MEKIFLITTFAFIVLLSGCTNNGSCEKAISMDGFFAWMDGYYATDGKSDNGVALTYIFERGHPDFQIDQVSSVQLADIQTDVITTDFSLEKHSYDGTNYDYYAIFLDFAFPEKDVFSTQKVVVRL